MNPDELKNINISEELEFNDGVGDVLKEKENYRFSWKKTVTVLSIGLVAVVLVTFSILEIGKLILDLDETEAPTTQVVDITSVEDAMSGINDQSWEILPEDSQASQTSMRELRSTPIESKPVKATNLPVVNVKQPVPPKVTTPKATQAIGASKAPNKKVIYRVIAGSFAEYTNAINELNRIKSMGFDGYVWSLTSPTNGVSYKVQIGAFSKRSTADKLVARLKSKKIDSYIAKH